MLAAHPDMSVIVSADQATTGAGLARPEGFGLDPFYQ